MKTMNEDRKRIRVLIALFVLGLILSGLTAFPLEWEAGLMSTHAEILPEPLKHWYSLTAQGILETNSRFPFMAYGTDWLAFSHIIIALFFLAPLKDPVRYRLIIEIGITACVLVFPLAFCCGPVRHIPFFWTLIDCSFGLGGGALLLYIHRKIRQLENRLSTCSKTPTHEKA